MRNLVRLLSKKIIITELNDRNLPDVLPADIVITYEDERADKVDLFYHDSQFVVGGIYVAHLNDLVKNISAAFVEYAPGQKAYLSLEDTENTFFINKKNTTKICQGDNILVQIKKEPIKTKDAVCSTAIELSGKYAVLTYGKPGIGVSAKIKDNSVRSKLADIGENFMKNMIPDKDTYGMITDERFKDIVTHTGVIFRTESALVSDYSLIDMELNKLFSQLFSALNKALFSPGRTCVKAADNPIIKIVSEVGCDTEIVTDNERIHRDLRGNNIEARFYEDKLLPLHKLYSVESVLSEIQSRKIWLKSGGYLIIDYTEAMTVIDVNTGKCEKGRDKASTILKINLEAAVEAMHQLRLRNVSGIVIIDFIDMADEDSKQRLIKQLIEEASKDKIKTSIMGMTRLNLVEITRKKIRERVTVKYKK